jgi:hypothetical protein
MTNLLQSKMNVHKSHRSQISPFTSTHYEIRVRRSRVVRLNWSSRLFTRTAAPKMRASQPAIPLVYTHCFCRTRSPPNPTNRNLTGFGLEVQTLYWNRHVFIWTLFLSQPPTNVLTSPMYHPMYTLFWLTEPHTCPTPCFDLQNPTLDPHPVLTYRTPHLAHTLFWLTEPHTWPTPCFDLQNPTLGPHTYLTSGPHKTSPALIIARPNRQALQCTCSTDCVTWN